MNFVFACLPAVVMAASQGLYFITPGDGWLVLVDPSTGTFSPMGNQSLLDRGWQVPADQCSPTAMDTTGKWMYVFARPVPMAESKTEPWYAHTVESHEAFKKFRPVFWVLIS